MSGGNGAEDDDGATDRRGGGLNWLAATGRWAERATTAADEVATMVAKWRQNVRMMDSLDGRPVKSTVDPQNTSA